MEIIKVLGSYRVSIDPVWLRRELLLLAFVFGVGVAVGTGYVVTHNAIQAARETAANRFMLEHMKAEVSKYGAEVYKCASMYQQ